MNLIKEYSKQELLDVAKELDMGVEMTMPSKRIIEAIIYDLDGEGLPDEDDCSDLMYNFLLDAEYYDDGGEDEVDEIEPEPTEQVPRPKCFGFADERAPECKRCKTWFDECMTMRLAIRSTMECFGKEFDINNEECSGCLEAGPCRIENNL